MGLGYVGRVGLGHSGRVGLGQFSGRSCLTNEAQRLVIVKIQFKPGCRLQVNVHAGERCVALSAEKPRTDFFALEAKPTPVWGKPQCLDVTQCGDFGACPVRHERLGAFSLHTSDQFHSRGLFGCTHTLGSCLCKRLPFIAHFALQRRRRWCGPLRTCRTERGCRS